MDSSVSGKDEIWFLRVCHHVPHELYTLRTIQWMEITIHWSCIWELPTLTPYISNHWLKSHSKEMLYFTAMNLYSETGRVLYTLSNKNPSAWKSRTGSHVTYSCHHNSSHFTFPIFAHSWRFSVFRSGLKKEGRQLPKAENWPDYDNTVNNPEFSGGRIPLPFRS